MNVGKSKEHLDITVNSGELLSNIVSCLGHFIEFVIVVDAKQQSTETSTRSDAFTIMMATQRSNKHLPAQLEEQTKKITLRNDILKWLGNNELGWSLDDCNYQGEAFVTSLGDTLWELDGHYNSLKDRGYPIPTLFEHFQGYNKPEISKHRKRTLQNLDCNKLQALSQRLFQLCGSSYLKRQDWKAVHEGVLRLADNLRKYCSYLEKKSAESKEAHANKIPRTDVDEWKIYSNSIIKPTMKARYNTLHEALLHAKPYDPIFVNEYAPSDRRRRNEYVDQFVSPCKVVRYSYTGSRFHLHFMWKANLDDSESDLMQKNDTIKETLRKQFPVYHSRSMRKEFIQHFGRFTGIKSAILREAYRQLTGDRSAANTLVEEQVDERIHQMLENEDTDLIWDLRMTNSGRTEQYTDFLTRCQEFVKAKVETAVDDRRHDALDEDGQSITHLAMALSVRDLHEQVSKECPEETAIPSVQWLRLQFWPNRASAAAHKKTGRIKIKFMVAARQFRKSHIDCYYASAIFRYEKEFCVKFRESTTFICEDDKHTIKVGEPDYPVAAVERGKKVVVGVNQTMVVGDHDFTKFSLSPSVSLDVEIPENMDGGFYDGQVYVGLKENAFQKSTALRHACERDHVLSENNKNKPIECHYHDGGPDHNVRHPRTQLSQIAYFLKRKLDLLIAVQTPPNHSWKNPAERVMSNLNLGLQGIGVMRQKTNSMEKHLKSANSLKEIRALSKKHAPLEEEVNDCIEPCRVLIGSVFSRLELKGKKFKVFNAATHEDLIQLACHLKCIDEDFDPEVLASSEKRKVTVSEKIKQFMEKHCVRGHYQFSIKKCLDNNCVCGTPRLSEEEFSQLHHLPFPVPQQDKYLHFGVRNAENEAKYSHM